MAETDPDPIFDAPLDKAAEAEIDAGKGVPHARVRAWLESWGKPNELPCPLPPE
jgi:predicted transcriptional regulator